ncbi:MAG: hypothetical protein JSS67_01720 [Bacteroidetes bacterium]|nr:hypothetical protein [Bacteroidota bacterium]
MKDEENIRKEIEEISPIFAGISNRMFNEIPSGYFDDFSEMMMFSVLKQNTISTGNSPFEMPSGYFDSLPNIILEKIKVANQSEAELNPADELKDIAPLLATISKENVYSIEPGYFAEKNWDFLLPKEKSSPKVISLPHWTHYLVAASVFAIITLGAVFYMGNYQTASLNVHSLAAELKELPDSAISNYLDDTPIYSIGVNNQEDQQIDINSLLYNVSDQQIEQYLDNTKDLSVTPGRNI